MEEDKYRKHKIQEIYIYIQKQFSDEWADAVQKKEKKAAVRITEALHFQRYPLEYL